MRFPALVAPGTRALNTTKLPFSGLLKSNFFLRLRALWLCGAEVMKILFTMYCIVFDDALLEIGFQNLYPLKIHLQLFTYDANEG